MKTSIIAPDKIKIHAKIHKTRYTTNKFMLTSIEVILSQKIEMNRFFPRRHPVFWIKHSFFLLNHLSAQQTVYLLYKEGYT